MDVRKNRFDGDLGRFQIVFDQEMQLYRDEMSNSGSIAAVTPSHEGLDAEGGARGEGSGMGTDESTAGASSGSMPRSRKHVVLDEIIMS